MYQCPVPAQHCSGQVLQTEPGNIHAKCHSNNEEVLNCIGRYYVSVMGYKKINRREFSKSPDGPILVISKTPGMQLRKGKEGSRYMRTKNTQRAIVADGA